MLRRIVVFVGLSWGEKNRLLDIGFELLDFWGSDKDISLMFVIANPSDQCFEVIDLFEELTFGSDVTSN